MMFSGHTMVTCLYGLACVECVRKYFLKKDWHHTRSGRRYLSIIVWTVSIIVLAEQCLEVYLVLKNRFHYTMDVIMALILVALLYTNAVFTVSAKRWELVGKKARPIGFGTDAANRRKLSSKVFGPH